MEETTANSMDKRNVIVQTWYAIDPSEVGAHSIYMDGLNRLPSSIGGIPSPIFNYFENINTHGRLNAPISKSNKKWPVIFFLTGNVSSRSFYTSIITGLASEGFVVLAVDHPYEAMISKLANGQIVTTMENKLDDDPELLKLMKVHLDLRVSDVQFVIDKLEKTGSSTDSIFSSFDLERIGITGHSLGGASGAVAMIKDPRIKAAANIDGTHYGDLPELKEKKPFLLIESMKDSNGNFQRYETGNQALFKYFEGGYRFEIPKADHFSFSNAPLFFGYPTRILLGKIVGFGNFTSETHQLTIRLLDSFFSNVLNKKTIDFGSHLNNNKELIIKTPY